MIVCKNTQFTQARPVDDVRRDFIVAGYFINLLVILNIVLMIGSTAFSNWWLSYWLGQGNGVRRIYLTHTHTHTHTLVTIHNIIKLINLLCFFPSHQIRLIARATSRKTMTCTSTSSFTAWWWLSWSYLPSSSASSTLGSPCMPPANSTTPCSRK